MASYGSAGTPAGGKRKGVGRRKIQSIPRHIKSSAKTTKAAARSTSFWRQPGLSWSGTKTKPAPVNLGSVGTVRGLKA